MKTHSSVPRLFLSPSKLFDYETCGYGFAKKHIDRWSEELTSSALVFGSAVDDTIDAWLRGLVTGHAVDIVATFDANWDAQTSARAIAYNTKFTPDNMRAMGRMMVQRFPAVWFATGYMVAIDPQGEPIMQRDLEIELPGGIVLRTKLDLMVVTRDGKKLIIDLKTSASVYPEYLTPLSEQLTAYQIAVEAHAATLGIEKIDGVGFIECIKRLPPKTSRGDGPTVEAPVVAGRRSEEQVAEYLQKVQWVADDIRRARFPRRSRAAYNSPCEMCFLQNHCAFGDDEGIVFPEAQRLQQQVFATAA